MSLHGRFEQGLNRRSAGLGDDAPNFVCKDRRLHSPHVALDPPCDAAREKMIHAFRWNRRPRLSVAAVPPGRYAVYAYIWEETSSETLTVAANGRVVARDVRSGLKGEWQRLGPWYVDVAKGALTITSTGGAANFSGIEIWQKK